MILSERLYLSDSIRATLSERSVLGSALELSLGVAKGCELLAAAVGIE
ncbi:MAG: hypothetical protein ACI8Z1_000855 [Candidatus Azotimanducaceae bacterium]|jgi:hypothetical protein